MAFLEIACELALTSDTSLSDFVCYRWARHDPKLLGPEEGRAGTSSVSLAIERCSIPTGAADQLAHELIISRLGLDFLP